MSRWNCNYISVKDINPEVDKWLINVQVLRIWGVHRGSHANCFASAKMVLIDAEHTKIQASISRDLMDVSQLDMHEGYVYLMSGLDLGVTKLTKILINPCNEEGMNLMKWYKMIVEVSDGEDTTYFSFLDSDIERLLGVSWKNMTTSFEMLRRDLLFLVDKSESGGEVGGYFRVESICDKVEIVQNFLSRSYELIDNKEKIVNFLHAFSGQNSEVASSSRAIIYDSQVVDLGDDNQEEKFDIKGI
ncbi:hypothetical protein VNO78_01401 [Psophocarpus tetragonolobus]|uniref:Replication protein A 70 kDa DNA-binding subunit B/D first OB fold domain-containing protein n=1 Tax=Psophocarpus tetragonolobus TaxID=3891 RepID=A0AAN9T9B3_PSOTE